MAEIPGGAHRAGPGDLGRTARVLLVSSSGGVLDDLMAMRPWWEPLDRRWVAVRAADTQQLLRDERVSWRADVGPSTPSRFARAVAAAERDLADRPVDLVV